MPSSLAIRFRCETGGNLKVSGVDLEEQTATTVCGKGGKTRIVPIGNSMPRTASGST